MTGGELDGGYRLVRHYVITNGRTRPARTGIGPRTVLVLARRGLPGQVPSGSEERALLRLCARQVPVSEVAAGLGLPVNVVTVLAADLADSGWLITRPLIPVVSPPGREILERVRDGLRRL